MTFVSNLEPEVLWKYFDDILTIPRGSKNEAAAREYVLAKATSAGLSFSTDPAGNVVVRRPASPGLETVPGTILQCHLDMVNEKNSEVEHNFDTDPIRPVRDGAFLKADGTTLGSDNGLGMAACLAILEDSELCAGPLECLFTVDEETGLTGASALSEDFLTGVLLINLDSEEEGSIYIGCAGGSGQNLRLPLDKVPSSRQERALLIALRGYRGGHSGVDIHRQRGNAIQLLSRILNAASALSFGLAKISGGNMHNAIPREAQAVVTTGSDSAAALRLQIESEFAAVQAQYRPEEPGAELTVQDTEPPAQILTSESRDKVLRLLHILPHGVCAMSYDIPELVETSCNLALARTESSALTIHLSSRSSSSAALADLQLRIDSAAALAGADSERLEGYPGWQTDLSSVLLGHAQEVYRRQFGVDPAIKAIHAGLECGIIKEKYPHLEMISIGPQIEFPHSPDERVQIDSVGRFYCLVRELLTEIARGE